MRRVALAFDTSNYTTSCALFDGENGENSGRLLDVEPGQLGLRQSDALFSHVKRLPDIVREIGLSGCSIIAVGASTRPREIENSYMPCFLAGSSQGEVLASALSVPFYAFSHQQGHIAAALWSAGRTELLDKPHLAWHLSGGTTELLFVRPGGSTVICQIIGGTSDISAGQVVDRTGKLLGLNFPSGRELDKLAADSRKQGCWKPKTNGLMFSLSGVEHKIKERCSAGEAPEETAYFALASVFSAVAEVTAKAQNQYGGIPVLYSGGVASNSLLRKLTPRGIFAEPKYSTDNALGTAILTWREHCAAPCSGVCNG